ncbi:hypothetical protein ACFOW4_16100 [Micromonospora sp. GCM10011542]|uniref:hypothetical protein n=1 Tax=Micromonospora sp. GCM10011542 TaxID=3317337 RepID=UPI00360CA007
MTERAVLLWVHGGGWRGRADEDGTALAAHGLRVVPARYRLVDEARWPALLDDVRQEARRARDGGLPLLDRPDLGAMATAFLDTVLPTG